MKLDLKDKVVVITGPAKGMGQAISLAFAEQGAKLVLRLQSISKISPWHGRSVQGYPIHTLLRGRFVMRDGQLVSDAAGWGRNIKPIQKMPTPKPRNTEHYSRAIVKASAHESPP